MEETLKLRAEETARFGAGAAESRRPVPNSRVAGDSLLLTRLHLVGTNPTNVAVSPVTNMRNFSA